MTSAAAPSRLLTLAAGVCAGVVAFGAVEGAQTLLAGRTRSWAAQPGPGPAVDCGSGQSVGSVYDSGVELPVGEPTLQTAAERWRRTVEDTVGLTRARTYRLDGHRPDQAVRVVWSTSDGVPRAALTVARARRGRWYVTGAERCAVIPGI